MNWKDFVRGLLRKRGYDICRYDLPGILRDQAINLLFDVGAYTGEYALALRRLGYTGRIVSCEPRKSAFAELTAKCGTDPDWSAEQVAIGSEEKTATIHVPPKSAASSILRIRAQVAAKDPSLAASAGEEITVIRFDSLYARHARPGDIAFLKIDTQGYEREVLSGATQSLPSLRGVQLEMSLVPVYEGETILPGLVTFMYDRGFALIAVDAGYRDPVTQHLLQLDGIFLNQHVGI